MPVALCIEMNILCMIMLSVMAYTAARFELDSTAQTHTFTIAIWSAFAMHLCDVFWALGLSRTIPMPVWVLHVINALYFTMLCCATFFWFVFSEYMFCQGMPRKRIAHLQLVMPLVALIALFLINPFTDCLFTFGPDLKRIRGPLYYMQSVLGVSYLLLSVALYLARRFSQRNNKYYLKQNEDTVFISFTIPLLLCIVLQIFLQNLPIVSVAIVIAFMLAYTSVIKLRITRSSYGHQQPPLAVKSAGGEMPQREKELQSVFSVYRYRQFQKSERRVRALRGRPRAAVGGGFVKQGVPFFGRVLREIRRRRICRDAGARRR